ncbi:MAG: hypothetical protein A3K19_24045 [Lentisphaerae bacterium RIFOXYB12_FULL_65_16]|nr:MAG: hypothetical protein A3K18_10240 [Lentisphaerae bacterium RIFOXYA12_64_32]OGV89589.1 MAG: hypothetical protein A3K19_24045 [Lentisphaerae bacterium RIFOXYB12_FULL_65_16]
MARSFTFLRLALLAATFSGIGLPPTPTLAQDGGNAKTALRIGFLLETYDVNRWARDEEFFVKKAESLGAEVIKAVADGDQDRQNKQAESFLVRGVNVLVVVPKNLESASRIVKQAHEAKVPVLAYDRLIRNCDVDLYVTFDNEKVGYLQAKGILEKVPEGNYILLGGAATDNNAKLLREGQKRAIAEHQTATGKTITVLTDPFLDNWDREEARRKVSNMITKFRAQGKQIHAIVASNDSTAGGAIAALKAENLAGQVAVSGQDAELSACQRIVEGTQTLTIYKPVRDLAETAAEVAVRLAKGEKPDDIIKALNHTANLLDNGTTQVPSIFLTPVFVTADNMAQTVIKDQWHPLEDVYRNLPKDKWPKTE